MLLIRAWGGLSMGGLSMGGLAMGGIGASKIMQRINLRNVALLKLTATGGRPLR